MRRAILAAFPAIILVFYAVCPAGATVTTPAVMTVMHRPAVTTVAVQNTPPRTYRVRAGDTLSSIAAHVYGHAARWPALWWANRHQVPNPDALATGQVLVLTTWHPARAWLTARALAAVPQPAPQRRGRAAAPAPVASAPAQPVTASYSYTGPGGFQSCVIAAESGGDPSAVNPTTGAGGLYGFLPSTWAALGYSGAPQDAPVAEQNAAFAREYAEGGTAAWAPYDGC